VSSKQSYALNPPPTNPNPVTTGISTGDSDLSSADVKHIKRNYWLKFGCTAEEIHKLPELRF